MEQEFIGDVPEMHRGLINTAVAAKNNKLKQIVSVIVSIGADGPMFEAEIDPDEELEVVVYSYESEDDKSWTYMRVDNKSPWQLKQTDSI